MKRLAPLLVALLVACATPPERTATTVEPLPSGVTVDGPHTGPRPNRFHTPAPPSAHHNSMTVDPLTKAVAQATSAKERKGRIDYLAISDAPIGRVAQLITENSIDRNVSLLVDPEVAVRLSLPFVLKNVYWLDALKNLAQANDLALTVGGIAPLSDTLPDGASLILATHERTTARQARATMAAEKTTQLLKAQRDAAQAKADTDALLPDAGLVTRSHRFRYADPKAALDYLETLYNSGDPVRAAEGKEKSPRTSAPPPRIRFSLFAPENLLTVQAPPKVAAEIVARMDRLDVRPRQVYIEARIVEIQRNYLKDLGIEWGGYHSTTTGTIFPHNVGVSGGNNGTGPYPGVISLPADSATDPTTGQPLANPRGGAIGVTIGSISGATVLQARLTALEQSGVSRTLSNPKVIALNGGQAVIKSGREIPYQSSSANLGTSVQFKEAVISLAVTPQILDDDRVRMKIVAKKDEVDPALSVQGIPAIKKKEITTNVVVASGDSAALGGVFEGADNSREDKTPGLGDIPFLGRLFRADHDDQSQLELLVFITPTILNEEGRP